MEAETSGGEKRGFYLMINSNGTQCHSATVDTAIMDGYEKIRLKG